jgi:DNA invertase Pin-like site-specific DNA recombinase
MRAAAYIRVSTDKQAADGVSLDMQAAKVRMYAELYGIELVELIVDEGASAKTLQREGLTRALSLLDSGEADGLIVYKLDRLTRSVRDLGELIDCYFGPKGSAALVSVEEQVDTSTATGRMILNVLMSVSQWERETIGERTSAALRHKAKQGEYTGGPNVPYGYRVAADGVRLEGHDGEQMVIAAIREYRAAGLSLRKIGAKLLDHGFRPRKGAKFSPNTINRIAKGARIIEQVAA